MYRDLGTICGNWIFPSTMLAPGIEWTKVIILVANISTHCAMFLLRFTFIKPITERDWLKPSDSALITGDFLLRQSQARPEESPLYPVCPGQHFVNNSFSIWNIQTLAWIGTWKVTRLGGAPTAFPFPNPLTSFLTKYRFGLECNGATAKSWLLSTPHRWRSSPQLPLTAASSRQIR